MNNPNGLPLTPPQSPEEQQQAIQAEADARIASLMDGTAAVENLTYKEKLERGGELGLNRLAEVSKVDQKDAINQAEAEGFDVSHTEPRRTMAAAKEHADKWTQEKDALRESREAANDRIAKLTNGSAAVEGLSYKDKLEKGGELGLKSIVESSKMNTEEAVAQAKMEGYNVTHAEPRHYEVVTNSAAEQRASEMAALLKSQTYKAPQPEVPAAPSEFAQEPDFDNDPYFDQAPVSDAEGEMLSPVNAEGESWTVPTFDEQSSVEPASAEQGIVLPEVADTETAMIPLVGKEALESERASIVADKKGVFSRTSEGVKNIFGKFGTFAGENFIKGKDRFNKMSKKNRVAAVVGVVAVVALAKYGFDHLNNTDPTILSDAGTPTPDAAPSTGGGNGNFLTDQLDGIKDHVTEAAEGGQDTNGAGGHVNLTEGSNPWSLAKEALGNNASVEDVDRVKDAILEKNGWTDAQAQSLAVDTRVKMPLDLIEKLNAENNK